MEIINLGGEEYYILKKEEIDNIERDKVKAEKDLELIKEMIGKSFADLKHFIEEDEAVEVQKDGTLKNNNRNPDNIFKVNDSQLYEIRFMNDEGEFYTKAGHKLKFTVKDVLKVQQKYHSGMTVSEVKYLRDKLCMSHYIFNGIIYNLQNGVFDFFIQEFHDKMLPEVNRDFKLPVENNTEKRKESELY